MNLKNILQKYNLDDTSYTFGTDKNTTHDYIEGFYEKGLKPYREKSLNVLEIGIYYGASMRLWKEYFTNAKIFGVDIFDRVLPQYKNLENTELIFKDAYTENIFDESLKFDVIIDDGPHTFSSQIDFIKKYVHKLNKNSIMIIEDVADISYIKYFESEVPDGFKFETIDLRKNKNRYDDLMFIIRN